MAYFYSTIQFCRREVLNGCVLWKYGQIATIVVEYQRPFEFETNDNDHKICSQAKDTRLDTLTNKKLHKNKKELLMHNDLSIQ